MRIIFIGAFMLASASVQAQVGVPVAPLARSYSENEQAQRFLLFTACQPVGLLVESLHQEAADIGLTKSDVITTVRSRLRGARIYSSDPKHRPYLYVNVNASTPPSYSVRVSLYKLVMDMETKLVFSAETWHLGATGTHGYDPGYIRQSIGEIMDTFIDQYLAVNESACE